MPIEDFLVDFYSKNTDQEVDQVKIDSIIDYYGKDNVSMINDLYEKYDTGNVNDDKVLEIQKYYSLDLPKQGEVVEETIVQETEVEEKEPVVEKELFNWKPSLSAEEYEALPLMDKERANWEKFKEIELKNQKEEVVKSDIEADTKAFSSLEDIPKYEGLTQDTTLEVDEDGLYDNL